MAVFEQDLDAYRGDTWAQTFRFLRGGVPVDFTDATVESHAQRFGVVHELGVVLGEPGEVTISLAPEMPVGAYGYDVESTEADGTVTTWVRGVLSVERDVTNAAAA